MNQKQNRNITDYYSIDDNQAIGEQFMPQYRGAYAKVIKGKQLKTGKVVAVKMYKRQKMDEDQEISLEKQIHIMKNINHPNIVNFYDFFVSKKCFCLVLQYLPGGQLYDHIIEKQTFTEDEAKKTILPIIDAIRYLHDSNIVHRDLKPQNIVFTSRGRQGVLKIIDFGVSQIVSPEAHYMSTAIGTPLYMAPQILKGQKYNQKVDYWSVGVILYVLLCGYPPFYSQNPIELQDLIKKAQVHFEPDDWKDVSQEAKSLIKGLLNPDPKARFGKDEIFDHPWIQNEVAKQKLEVVDRLKKFRMALRNVMNMVKFLTYMKMAE